MSTPNIEVGGVTLGFKVLVMLTIVMVVSSAQSENRLTREQALTIINQHNVFTSKYNAVRLHQDGYSKGVQQGFWRASQSNQGMIEITQRARSIFTQVTSNSVSLIQPVGIRAVEVTGVTDSLRGAGMKEAQFIWEYQDLPSIAKRFVLRGGSGVAEFRLYDDGWRIENLSLKDGTEPASLSASERADEEKDRNAEVQRQEAERQQKEMQEAQKKAEAGKLARLVEESKQPTHDIGKYRYVACAAGGAQSKSVYGQVTLTDAGMNFSGTNNCLIPGWGRSTTIAFYYLYKQNQMPISGEKSGNLFYLKTRSGSTANLTPLYGVLAVFDETEGNKFLETLNQAFANWKLKHAQVISK
jgi:hypothetical protein